MTKILISLIFIVSSAFSRSLNASDIDMSTALSDISFVVLLVLNVLILLFTHKKILQMLGK